MLRLGVLDSNNGGGEGRPSEDLSEMRPLQWEHNRWEAEERWPWGTSSLTLKTFTWRQTRYHQICSFCWMCHCCKVAVSTGHTSAQEQQCMPHTARCLNVCIFSLSSHHCLQTNMSASTKPRKLRGRNYIALQAYMAMSNFPESRHWDLSVMAFTAVVLSCANQ